MSKPTELPPTFYIQARRSTDGNSFVVQAGWDTVAPPRLTATHGQDSRIGRALASIEGTITPKAPASRSRA